ncbi:replication factor A protein [Trifolium repens]|nr:replication factor A protein [Trifolium repens]
MDFVVVNRYQDLISVDSTKGNAIYELRVLRKWKVVDLSKPNTIGCVDLVLIDIHDIKIHATIPKKLVPIFDEKIIEGRVYRISSVDVRFNFGTLIPSYHRYKFYFTDETVVDPSSNSFIPAIGFSLVEAKDIRNKGSSFRYLVDVVGLITSAIHDKNFFPDGTVSQTVTFKLNDESMVEFLTRNLDYTGLYRSSRRLPVSYTMEYLKDYPIRTMAELKSNAEVGYFIVNARICDIVTFDPWWYAMCDCPRVFKDYIGDFRCVKCQAEKWTASPKIKLTFEVDDETGSGLFRAFDHVMINVAAVNSTSQAFDEVLGKSIMFIVRKNRHEPNYVGTTYDVMRVADSASIIEYFKDKGVSIVPSKVLKKNVVNSEKQPVVTHTDHGTTTTEELIKLYLSGVNPSNPSPMDVASSSGSKRSRAD